MNAVARRLGILLIFFPPHARTYPQGGGWVFGRERAGSGAYTRARLIKRPDLRRVYIYTFVARFATALGYPLRLVAFRRSAEILVDRPTDRFAADLEPIGIKRSESRSDRPCRRSPNRSPIEFRVCRAYRRSSYLGLSFLWIYSGLIVS